MIATRSWWSHRLTHDLAVEVCGLIEILSTSPTNSVIRQCLTNFVDRICTLGSPALPQMLASSAIDTLLDVFHAASTEGINGAATCNTDSQHQEITDPAATSGAAASASSW